MASTPLGYPAPDSSVDVIIIGAGFGGLGMGTQLAREGKSSFIVLERAEEVGGTWRDNHYPGAACDVPSHLYSFSFRPNPEWSRMFAPQKEILDYLRHVARDENFHERIVFGAEVTSARWDDAAALWNVATPKGDFSAKTLVTAVGHLSEPKLPNIDGLSDFSGSLFHSAEWADEVDLVGKRVGVIGSGATAIQVMPEVAKIASEVVVFQRSAPYVTPRPDRAYSDQEKGLFRKMPESIQELREEMFWSNEERYAQRRGTPTLVSAATQVALDHLHRQIQDPGLRRKLTPDYIIGCKRVLKSNDYYPAFVQEHVHLETDGIERVEGNRVITTDGGSHELDVIVACTGFETTDLPIAYRIFGRNDLPLSERWSNGMQAYATTAVHGFPNLWIINGPNTGLGHNSAVYIAEAQIDYIMAAVNFREAADLPALEVAEEAEEAFMDRVDRLAEGTVWLEGGCRSWYVDHRNGRLTTLWPEPAYTFRQVNAHFEPEPYLTGSEDETVEQVLTAAR